MIEAVAPDGAWAVICQARVDSNGDGTIGISVGLHGDTWGDALRPYLVRGAGAGEPIDTLIGHDHAYRRVVAIRAGALAVLDADADAWIELPGADLRDDGVPLGPHRAAAITPDGTRLVYFRDDDTLVIRALATGKERAVDVPGARLWRVEPRADSRHARVYALRKDTDGDGVLTWPSVRTSLSERDCRGPITSYSTGGWDGDEPDELWLDLAAGTVGEREPPPGPDTTREDPELGTWRGQQVLAIDAAGRKLVAPASTGRGLPTGPLRWVSP